MRLFSFRIQNFKSIVDTGVCKISPVDNIVTLAGQNESGKSATLEALDFFRNGPSKNFDKLLRRQDTLPEVTCTFSLLNSEITDILSVSKNEKLNKFLIRNPFIEFQRGFPSTEGGEVLDRIFFSDQFEETINPFFESEPKKEDADQTEVPTEEKVYTLDQFREFIIDKIKKFVFYTDFPDYLPGEILVSEIPKNEAVQNFEKVFKVKFAELVNSESRAIQRAERQINAMASDDLNTYWQQKINAGGKYDFIIKITKNSADPQNSMVEFSVDSGDKDPLYVEQKSKGFRWFSAFNLKLRALSIDESEIKNLVILIDEPGQGLHEKAQQDAKLIIEELAKKGAQIIYSTHNPGLIGTGDAEFSRIRLISNEDSSGTKILNISQYISQNGEKDALSPIRTAMGLNGISSLFDEKDRFNIVVEGITDHFYMKAIQKHNNYNQKYFFVPACGASNVKNVVGILIGWGTHYKVLLDKDSHQGEAAKNILKKNYFNNDEIETLKFVLQPSWMKGIEDVFSKNDFIKYVAKDPSLSYTGSNSEFAKTRGKEFMARLFLDEISNGTRYAFDDDTKRNITEIFTWLDQAFT